jgi:hypothetical protein
MEAGRADTVGNGVGAGAVDGRGERLNPLDGGDQVGQGEGKVAVAAVKIKQAATPLLFHQGGHRRHEKVVHLCIDLGKTVSTEGERGDMGASIWREGNGILKITSAPEGAKTLLSPCLEMNPSQVTGCPRHILGEMFSKEGLDPPQTMKGEMDEGVVSMDQVNLGNTVTVSEG